MRIRLAGALYRGDRASSHAPQSRAHPVRDRHRRISRRRQVDHRTTPPRASRALPRPPHVELVTTDGFLFPNAELERRGILDRKGFPESYDRKALLRFVIDVKSGVEVVTAPVYSHLTYDRTDEVVTVKAPDIIIVEGLRRARPGAHPRGRQPGSRDQRLLRLLDLCRRRRARTSAGGMSNASSPCARPHSPTRPHTSTATARSPTTRPSSGAGELWDRINWPNLRENIQTTRGRASLVLRKGSDHAVDWVRLRKL